MKIDRDYYTSHIHNKDKIFEMRKLLDKIEIVSESHSIQSTDFLDPYERLLAQSILNRFQDIRYLYQGGIDEAERKSIVIYPDYYDCMDIPEHIIALRIKGNLDKIKHKDYLGAILGLGIKRNKLGDIFIHNEYTDIVLKEEIGSFVYLNLDKVGNEKVKIQNISLNDLEKINHNYMEINKTLSSLRLDVYLSSIYNLSRSESMNLIKAGYVKINHEPIDKSSKEILEGDLISTKGYGRSTLYSVEGLSKKNKIRTNIRIFI